MTQEERLDFLISQLLCESAEYKDIPVPTAQEEKRQLLRALMNVRSPRPASDEFLRVQDEYLKERLAERGGMTTLKICLRAQAVVIGAGAGLSTAAGFTYSGKRFERTVSLPEIRRLLMPSPFVSQMTGARRTLHKPSPFRIDRHRIRMYN